MRFLSLFPWLCLNILRWTLNSGFWTSEGNDSGFSQNSKDSVSIRRMWPPNNGRLGAETSGHCFKEELVYGRYSHLMIYNVDPANNKHISTYRKRSKANVVVSEVIVHRKKKFQSTNKFIQKYPEKDKDHEKETWKLSFFVLDTTSVDCFIN